MDAALHLKIQHAGWNKAAPFYDNLWQKQLKPAQDLMVSLARIKRGEMVLDVCCGSGLVTLPVARTVGPLGQVTGIDFSEEMLEVACKTAKNYSLANIRFQSIDAENLTFPSQQFNVAMNALGLMYLADPNRSIQEMYRVLKPGGRAVALVWGARKNCGWAEVFPIVDKRVTTDVCPLFFQQGSGHTLRQAFEAAGFMDTEEERLSDFIHFENEDDASDAMFIGGPVSLAWKHFDIDTRKSARAEYLNSLKPYKNGRGYHIPAEFVVVKGIKN